MKEADQIALKVCRIAMEHGQENDKEASLYVWRKEGVKEPEISVVIPYMQIDDDKVDVLRDTLKSFEGADEIIVVVNWRMGYAKPINVGLKNAAGKYLMVMNDDMTWDGSSLARLKDPDKVMSPTINRKPQIFWGCSFMIPRAVYEKVGGLFEGYDISYFDDDDYQQTLKKAGVKMMCQTSINADTDGGRTLERFPDRDEFFEKNRQLFIKRWGFDPTQPQ